MGKTTRPAIKPEIEGKMEKLRIEDEAFGSLVKKITQEIEKQIEEWNSDRSFNPTDSTDHTIYIKVDAVPITKEEKKTLQEYLEWKYLHKVLGSYITIEKGRFSKKFIIRSRLGYY